MVLPSEESDGQVVKPMSAVIRLRDGRPAGREEFERQENHTADAIATRTSPAQVHQKAPDRGFATANGCGLDWFWALRTIHASSSVRLANTAEPGRPW